jgi:hypothetical protein
LPFNHGNQFLVVGYDSGVHEHSLLTLELQSSNMLSRLYADSQPQYLHIFVEAVIVAVPKILKMIVVV